MLLVSPSQSTMPLVLPIAALMALPIVSSALGRPVSFVTSTMPTSTEHAPFPARPSSTVLPAYQPLDVLPAQLDLAHPPTSRHVIRSVLSADAQLVLPPPLPPALPVQQATAHTLNLEILSALLTAQRDKSTLELELSTVNPVRLQSLTASHAQSTQAQSSVTFALRDTSSMDIHVTSALQLSPTVSSAAMHSLALNALQA